MSRLRDHPAPCGAMLDLLDSSRCHRQPTSYQADHRFDGDDERGGCQHDDRLPGDGALRHRAAIIWQALQRTDRVLSRADRCDSRVTWHAWRHLDLTTELSEDAAALRCRSRRADVFGVWTVDVIIGRSSRAEVQRIAFGDGRDYGRQYRADPNATAGKPSR
jgi:hypothetical protein